MAPSFDPTQHPHRRRNPLTGDWVVVSPHRTQRPWRGQTDDAIDDGTPPFDPTCPLCPRNTRAGGATNPDYDSTFVFRNDFAALLPGAPSPHDDGSAASAASAASADGEVAAGSGGVHELFDIAVASGECRVICFSPRHDLTLSRMDDAQIGVVIDLWRTQYAELITEYEWVQIFETRGAISGSSNPHPHGQIWASDYLPNEAVREIESQGRYVAAHGSPMLVDYATHEVATGDRVIVSNDHWVIVVPYWAYWPYETLVLPRRRVASLADLDDSDTAALADVLGSMLRAYDRLFDTPFPYCSGWHSSPATPALGWQLHAHYYPPLLRSAGVAKIPASYELLANLQRDLTPETAAANLREVL